MSTARRPCTHPPRASGTHHNQCMNEVRGTHTTTHPPTPNTATTHAATNTPARLFSSAAVSYMRRNAPCVGAVVAMIIVTAAGGGCQCMWHDRTAYFKARQVASARSAPCFGAVLRRCLTAAHTLYYPGIERSLHTAAERCRVHIRVAPSGP